MLKLAQERLIYNLVIHILKHLLLLIDDGLLHEGLLYSIKKLIQTLRMHKISFAFTVSLTFMFLVWLGLL